MPRKRMSHSNWMRLVERETEKCKAFTGRVMVNVSGGAASSVCWWRCIEMYGRDRVFPVFADTQSEDEDLYRFLDDCERRFEQKLVRLSQGKNIWDIFDSTGIMRVAKSGNACKASIELKIKPLDAYLEQHQFEAVAVGIQFDEPERVAAFNKRTISVRVRSIRSCSLWS
jgi:3'-phosphoadenosine 5'-phosphosulfate sulfotransferase (PAPS reductase)/FAD synthetase